MNVVDLILIIAMAAFAFTGWRRGFVYATLSMLGFLGGAALGLVVAPRVVQSWDPGFGRAAVGIGIVLVLATVGQVLIGYAGKRMKDLITWKPAALLDSLLGAAVSVVSILLIAWLAASAFVHSSGSPVAADVRDSRVLRLIDEAMPGAAQDYAARFKTLLDHSGFPDVFSGLNEPIAPIAAPNTRWESDPDVQRAAASTVRVDAKALACSQHLEGSGFVYAPERVMTNAHVVAGSAHPQVQVGGEGKLYDASVVYFDPSVDVAVLAVPGLPTPPLAFGPALSRGDGAVVIGYPENGPLSDVAARIRTHQLARGQDIYATTSVIRDIYSMRALVLHGNSGGPLVDLQGDVAGVVFASSLDHYDTGYALTADQVSKAAAQGIGADQPVATGPCT